MLENAKLNPALERGYVALMM
ncbi:MAG: hypothetical protein K0S16_766, partial [Moraxellaceae bacterium]|nr:hypothetical protein [Moraxellaceae bacterium]